MSTVRATNDQERCNDRIAWLQVVRRGVIDQISKMPTREIGTQREERFLRTIRLINEEIEALRVPMAAPRLRRVGE